MASTNIETAFKERGTGPYPSPLKCVVVAVLEEYTYTGRNRQQLKGKNAAVSDGTSLAKVMCYDEAKFRYMKVNQTVVMRNIIKRVEDVTKIIVWTKVTKVFMSAPLSIPDEHLTLGQALLDPPPAEVVTVLRALSSPPKKKVSVKAKIIQEDEVTKVEVRGQEVPIKKLLVEDESGQGKITLWRECASASNNMRPGDYVVITDVVTNVYNQQTSLSTTSRSSVKKCEGPTVEKNVVIEGVSVNKDQAEVYLDDGSCLQLPSEMLHMAVMADDAIEDLEMCTSDGPLFVKIIYKGSTITDITKM